MGMLRMVDDVTGVIMAVVMVVSIESDRLDGLHAKKFAVSRVIADALRVPRTANMVVHANYLIG